MNELVTEVFVEQPGYTGSVNEFTPHPFIFYVHSDLLLYIN